MVVERVEGHAPVELALVVDARRLRTQVVDLVPAGWEETIVGLSNCRHVINEVQHFQPPHSGLNLGLIYIKSMETSLLVMSAY